MAKEKSSGKGRTRNFASVVYPDSAPDVWKDVLSAMRIPAFISPLHDKDINPDGTPKKPHYHIVLMFDSVKTEEQARYVFEQIKAVGCEKIQSLRGYARYLCHLDNPEKAQYEQSEVQCLSGADYIGTIGLVLDKYKAIGEMIDYCEENGIISFSELLKYARVQRFDWFRILCDNGTVVIKEYLKSKAWTERRERSF